MSGQRVDYSTEVLPVCTRDGGKCLFTEAELVAYLVEQEIAPRDARLYRGTPWYFEEVDPGYWDEQLGEGVALPEAVGAALDAFNAILRAQPAASWACSDVAVDLPADLLERGR